MDTVDKALVIAERIVLLRSQLAEAERSLRILLEGDGAPVARAVEGLNVAQTVRAMLQAGPQRFGDLVKQSGGKPMAVRAALKRLLGKKQVKRIGHEYHWK